MEGFANEAPGPMLVLALALGVTAQRQSWRPTLGQTLAVGAGLRVTVALLAHANHWQPFDFAYDFPHAGENVLQHRDPLLNVRPYGWNYLPTMAYVFAAQLKIAAVTGLPWTIAGRLVPVAADLMVTVLVGNISGGQKRLRRFQYATNPVAILVASVHGQMEPLCLASASRRLWRHGPAVDIGLDCLRQSPSPRNRGRSCCYQD